MSLKDRIPEILANDLNQLKFTISIIANVIKHQNESKYCDLNFNRVQEKLNQKPLFMDILFLIGFKKTNHIKPRLKILTNDNTVMRLEVAEDMLKDKLNALQIKSNNQSSKPPANSDHIYSQRSRDHNIHIDCSINQTMHDTEEKIQYENPWKKKNKFDAIARNGVRCNGDCGSGVSKIIENCLNKQNGKIANYKTIIRNAFSHYQNPARTNLVNLMENVFAVPMEPVDIDKHDYHNTPLTNGKYSIFQQLKDENTKINDKMCEQILQLFRQFVEDNNSDILQELANCTCRVPEKSLCEEISDNTQKAQDELKEQLESIKTIICYTEKKSNYTNNNEKAYTVSMIKSLNQHKEYIEKQLQTVSKTYDIIETHESLLELAKQTKEYKEMEARNQKLSDLEIMAVLIYCNQDFYCYQMRKAHRLNINSCKWKQLYYYLCNGINKMYLTFYYKKDTFDRLNFENALYHGSHLTSIHETNRLEISLNTVTSFSSQFAEAVNFAGNNGMVLILTDVKKKLKCGDLRGADVNWLPIRFKENEFMILPTTFKNVKTFTKDDEKDLGMILVHNNHVELYKTDNYKSQNLKCLRFDLGRRVFLNKFFNIDSHDREEIRNIIFVSGALIGPFIRYQCSVCNIKSRFLYFTGSIMDMTAECPCCRHQFLQIGNNRTRDEFQCRNTLTCGTITHSDLRALNDDDIANGKLIDDGYICTKCDKQQVIAEIYSLKNDGQYLEDRTKYYKNIFEGLVNQNGENHLNIDLEIGKRLVLWLFENKDATFFAAVNQCPEIYDWFLSVPSIKKAFVKLISDFATKRKHNGRFLWHNHVVDALDSLIDNFKNTKIIVDQDNNNENGGVDLNDVVNGVQQIVTGDIGNGIRGLTQIFE
eukprot:13588_1